MNQLCAILGNNTENLFVLFSRGHFGAKHMSYFPACLIMKPQVLGSHSVQDVLVAHVLEAWSSYRQLSCESQIQLRFALSIFTQGMVNEDQILRICHQFQPHIGSAANILVTGLRSPEVLGSCTKTYHWSNNEDMLLLVYSLSGNSNAYWVLAARRPPETWPNRLQLIVRKLEKTRALISPWMSESERELVVVPPPLSINQKVANVCPHCRRRARAERGRAMTEKRKIRLECKRLKAKLMSKEKHVKHLQESMARVTLALEEDEPSEELSEGPTEAADILNQFTDPTLQTKFLEEICQLSLLEPERRTYSVFVLEISELLVLTSRKTYRLLRQMLPLPSESCLRYHFGEMLRQTKLLLTSEECIGTHIDTLITDVNDRDDVVTIAIDAFSFRTFHDTTTFKTRADKEEHSNAFVFLHVPLNADAQVKTIVLKSQKTGAFNSTISETFHMVAEEYSRRNMKIWFKATDGDRFMDREHNLFYEKYVEAYRDNFDRLIRCIHKKLTAGEIIVPIADPLHFAKNLRGKLIDHEVVVVNAKTIHFVTRNELQSVLGLGQVLDDKSQIGRMRDVYVTRLFTLANIVRLMKAGCSQAAFLLLPYACLFTVLYSDNLTTLDRMCLVHLSYICFDVMLEENAAIVRDHREIRYRFSKSCKGITSAEPSKIRRMIHTCLSFGISMTFGPNLLRLGALGTHLVENTIGIARCVSNSSDYARIVSAFANAETRKTLARKYDITLHIPKRVTDGGAKINIRQSEVGIIPGAWDPRRIVSMMKEACISKLQDQAAVEYQQFMSELEEVVSRLHVRKLSNPSEVANASIMKRNYAYNGRSNTLDL